MLRPAPSSYRPTFSWTELTLMLSGLLVLSLALLETQWAQPNTSPQAMIIAKLQAQEPLVASEETAFSFSAITK